MKLIDKIKVDQVDARKNRESLKATLLTTLLGEAGMVGKNDGNRDSTDEEVIAVVKKFIKGIDESLSYQKDEAALATLKAERSILEVYLPKQMTEEEIRYALGGKPKDKGTLMKFFKFQYSGLYDGKLLSQIVDEYIKS